MIQERRGAPGFCSCVVVSEEGAWSSLVAVRMNPGMSRFFLMVWVYLYVQEGDGVTGYS